MKKSIKFALTSALALSSVLATTSCSNSNKSSVKIGLITLHDSNSTYDKNFIDSMTAACKAENVELIVKTGIGEDEGCYNAAAELADSGCKGVFADSFGHEQYMIKAAKEFTNVQFGHATGTQSKQVNLANYHNAFASIYEGRYLAGVAAGMKLQEMITNNTLPKTAKMDNGNYKLGYVGAYTYAEVVSGYTSWYLGVKSVVSNVTMDVTFTGSWYDEAAEREAANTLITSGAAIVSQHADSMGAPSACETAGVPNVSYNGSTATACPNTFIVSSRIDWTPYFTMMIQAIKKGESYATDYTGSLTDGMVKLTDLGTAAASGTAAKIEEVKTALNNKTLKVFDTSKFTVAGNALTTYQADVDGDYKGDTEAIVNGEFTESTFRSAPYFDVQIDGINLLNTKF